MATGRIRIESSGPLFKNWRVLLDGQDISHMLRGIKISADVHHQRPVVELDLVGFVEMPADVQVLLRLKVDEEQALRERLAA
jgi:hypothetical protein